MAFRKKSAEATSAPKSAGRKQVAAGPDRSEKAAALMADINKRMAGRAELVPASELSMPYITQRLPTGLLSLDLELKGGFPSAGLSQIYGPKNCGKTYLYWQVIRQLQAILGKDMMVLLAMTEMRADRTQARLAGVRVAICDEDIEALDASRVRNGWPAFTPEERAEFKVEVGTIHELHAESAELLFDSILRAVDENIYHLIVVDSIGSIMSGAEAEAESLSEKHYGGAAKPITEWLRKLTAMLTIRNKEGETRDSTVIVINQVRDAIGDPNKQYRTTGGNALEHHQFVNLFLRQQKVLGDHEKVYAPGGTTQKFTPWGKEIAWEIQKGKAGIHDGARGSFYFDHRLGGVDFALDTLVAGVRNGVIVVSGAWIGIPDPESPGRNMVQAQGQAAFCELLRRDAIESAQTGEESWLNYIRDACFRRNDINISYRWGK